MSMKPAAVHLRNYLAALALASVFVPAAGAAIPDPLGSAAPSAAAVREVKINKSTKAINVSRHEILRFVNEEGKSFTWHFYTLHHPTIPMNMIAPAGFAQHEVLIFVGPGPDELN